MISKALESRPMLRIPQYKKHPDFCMILEIIYSDYKMNQERLHRIVGAAKETMSNIKSGRLTNPQYKVASALTQIALSNFTVKQLEECNLL